jgi:hypothetical protein
MTAVSGLANKEGFVHKSLPASSAAIPVNKSESDANVLNYEYELLVSKGYDTNSQDDYPIQIGAFKTKENADDLYNKVKGTYSIDSKIVYEDGFYKVRISRMPPNKKIADLNPAEKTVVVKTLLTDTVVNTTFQNAALSQIPSDSIINDTILRSSPNDTLKKNNVLPNTMKAAEKLLAAFRSLFIIKGESPWLKRINYFGKSLVFVNGLILAIIISIASMVILLFIILMNRNKMEKEDHLHQFLMEKYQGLIVDYLFGTASHEDFKSIASDTYRRQVLIDQMIDVSINLKGEESKRLLNLYVLLSLDKDSIAKANDYRWHIKIKGFRELAFMNIKKANDAIYRALNSSNEILRMEAQIALVRLSDENHFDFLSSLKTPFSLWEQITLHDLIIQHNIPLPLFQKWLTSPNPTVVMFSLRMIREFKQKEAEEKVKETLLHPNPDVRLLAVQVAGDMDMRSTLETMKSMYKNQDNKICLEIVKAMGKMPDLSMMNFLKLVLDKEDDVQLQIEATKAIENNGEEGVKALVKLMKSEYKNYNIIIRHVLDRRIF